MVFKGELSGWRYIAIGTQAIQSSLTPRNETYLNGLSTSIILSQLIFNALSRPRSLGPNPCGSGRKALAAGYAEMNPNLSNNEICISISQLVFLLSSFPPTFNSGSIDRPLPNAIVQSDVPKRNTPRSWTWSLSKRHHSKRNTLQLTSVILFFG